MMAVPAFHGFGITKAPGFSWSARNVLYFWSRVIIVLLISKSNSCRMEKPLTNWNGIFSYERKLHVLTLPKRAVKPCLQAGGYKAQRSIMSDMRKHKTP